MFQAHRLRDKPPCRVTPTPLQIRSPQRRQKSESNQKFFFICRSDSATQDAAGNVSTNACHTSGDANLFHNFLISS